MTDSGNLTPYPSHHTETGHPEALASGVTWSAVIAGAFATAALYLLLLALGAGLGLSSVSVWSSGGISATAIGTATILWLIVAEIVSSSMGGYLAGRLRTKWTVIHGDEVYFRDTAHGFLAWSVALVVTAAFLGSAAMAMIGSSTTSAKTNEGGGNYFADSMLRTATPMHEADTEALHGEVTTILAASLKHGSLSGEDRNYLDNLVAARTGMDHGAADARVSEVYQEEAQAAEAARKATAHTLLWGFIALLIGAFCASVFGTIGGKQRDNVVVL
jgi:hypothetical protein